MTIDKKLKVVHDTMADKTLKKEEIIGHPLHIGRVLWWDENIREGFSSLCEYCCSDLFRLDLVTERPQDQLDQPLPFPGEKIEEYWYGIIEFLYNLCKE